MEFDEIVRRRRMVRAYDPDRPVGETAIEAVLDAARRTPSAGFTQGVSLLVLSADEDRAAFWALSRPIPPDGSGASARSGGSPDRWLTGMRAAPVLVLVWTSERAYRDRYAEPDKAPALARDGRLAAGAGDRDGLPWSVPYWYVDAGMTVQAMLYAAVGAGVGAAFVAVPEPAVAPVRARFGVPAEQLVVGLVTLGHPAATSGPPGSPARRRRRPAAEVVRRGHWSGGSVTGR